MFTWKQTWLLAAMIVACSFILYFSILSFVPKTHAAPQNGEVLKVKIIKERSDPQLLQDRANKFLEQIRGVNHIEIQYQMSRSLNATFYSVLIIYLE